MYRTAHRYDWFHSQSRRIWINVLGVRLRFWCFDFKGKFKKDKREKKISEKSFSFVQIIINNYSAPKTDRMKFFGFDELNLWAPSIEKSLINHANFGVSHVHLLFLYFIQMFVDFVIVTHRHRLQTNATCCKCRMNDICCMLLQAFLMHRSLIILMKNLRMSLNYTLPIYCCHFAYSICWALC